MVLAWSEVYNTVVSQSEEALHIFFNFVFLNYLVHKPRIPIVATSLSEAALCKITEDSKGFTEIAVNQSDRAHCALIFYDFNISLRVF